jgi:hypothetical protein
LLFVCYDMGSRAHALKGKLWKQACANVFDIAGAPSLSEKKFIKRSLKELKTLVEGASVHGKDELKTSLLDYLQR